MRILGQVASLSAARGLGAILAFVASVLLPRMMGPTAYGQYAVAVGLIMFVQVVGVNSLKVAGLRYAVHADANQESIEATLIGALLLVWTAALLLMPLLVTSGLAPNLALAAVAGAAVGVWGWVELATELARARLRLGRFNVLAIGRGVGMLAGGVLGWYLGGSAWSVLAGQVGALAVIAMAAPPAVAHFTGLRTWRTAPLGKTVIGYATPLAFAFFFIFVMNTSDRLIIGALAGDRAAGFYAAGYDLAMNPGTFLLSTLSLAIYPHMVIAVEQGRGEGLEGLRRANWLTLVALGGALTVGMALGAKPIVRALLGEEFVAAATPIIPLVLVASWFAALRGYHFDLLLQLERKPRMQMAAAILGAVANLVCIFTLLRPLGLVGAAAATTVGFGVACWSSARSAARLGIAVRERLELHVLMVTAALALGGHYVLHAQILPWILLGVITIAICGLDLLDGRSEGVASGRRLWRSWFAGA